MVEVESFHHIDMITGFGNLIWCFVLRVVKVNI